MQEAKESTPSSAAKIRKGLEGKPAPDFTVADILGQPFTLSAFRGGTVLLDFRTTWCPPCRNGLPALGKFYRKHGDGDW